MTGRRGEMGHNKIDKRLWCKLSKLFVAISALALLIDVKLVACDDTKSQTDSEKQTAGSPPEKKEAGANEQGLSPPKPDLSPPTPDLSQPAPALAADQSAQGPTTQEKKQEANLDELLLKLIELEKIETIKQDDCDNWSALNARYMQMKEHEREPRPGELKMKERCGELEQNKATEDDEDQLTVSKFTKKLLKKPEEIESVANLARDYFMLRHTMKGDEHMTQEFDKALEDESTRNIVVYLKSFIRFLVSQASMVDEFKIDWLDLSIKQLLVREHELDDGELKELDQLAHKMEQILFVEKPDGLDADPGTDRYRFFTDTLDAAHAVILEKSVNEPPVNDAGSAPGVVDNAETWDQDEDEDENEDEDEDRNERFTMNSMPKLDEELDDMEEEELGYREDEDFSKAPRRSLKSAGLPGRHQGDRRRALNDWPPIREPIDEPEPEPELPQPRQPRRAPAPRPEPLARGPPSRRQPPPRPRPVQAPVEEYEPEEVQPRTRRGGTAAAPARPPYVPPQKYNPRPRYQQQLQYNRQPPHPYYPDPAEQEYNEPPEHDYYGQPEYQPQPYRQQLVAPVSQVPQANQAASYPRPVPRNQMAAESLQGLRQAAPVPNYLEDSSGGEESNQISPSQLKAQLKANLGAKKLSVNHMR